jgi:hypothetical protein
VRGGDGKGGQNTSPIQELRPLVKKEAPEAAPALFPLLCIPVGFLPWPGPPGGSWCSLIHIQSTHSGQDGDSSYLEKQAKTTAQMGK